MIDPATKTRFQRHAAHGSSASVVEALARRLKRGGATGPDQARLAAAVLHAAVAAPERMAEIYDAAATGWFDAPAGGAPVITAQHAPLPVPEAFWTDFWALAEGSAGSDAGAVTRATAALGGALDAGHMARLAETCLAWPGVKSAMTAGFPPRTRLADLEACPAGSLGAAFHRLIVDNGFDLEVLDRDALDLAGLPPPLDYLNARMLQTHDLWHIVAGYRTTKLHEVAISAFQMAQFGHGYSALFLALVATSSAFAEGPRFSLIMEMVLSAWVHGRRTPPMLLIAWEAEWTDTIDGHPAAPWHPALRLALSRRPRGAD